ncbi:MAG TPA: hypothetical protein VN843_26080 [Anaerolineales bacterium]|nr:hypothetical protein [Anaerolineales bacterium]
MAHGHNQRHEKRTFQRIVDSVALENAMRLTGRARLANGIAKTLSGDSRLRAYAVKHQTLLTLKAKFPDRVRIVTDFKTPRFVLVESRSLHFGLHAPEQLFGTPARVTLTAVPTVAAKRQAA